MTYVLDGIQTAMVETPQSAGGFALWPKIECPCGWVAPGADVNNQPDLAALRFHYQNCPQARPKKPGVYEFRFTPEEIVPYTDADGYVRLPLNRESP